MLPITPTICSSHDHAKYTFLSCLQNTCSILEDPDSRFTVSSLCVPSQLSSVLETLYFFSGQGRGTLLHLASMNTFEFCSWTSYFSLLCPNTCEEATCERKTLFWLKAGSVHHGRKLWGQEISYWWPWRLLAHILSDHCRNRAVLFLSGPSSSSLFIQSGTLGDGMVVPRFRSCLYPINPPWKPPYRYTQRWAASLMS